MKPNEKSDLIQLYEDRFAVMGYDMRTIGWKGREDQQLRFDILCDVADLSGKSVCDIGCGFGDLYDYLGRRFAGVRYTGIDLVPSLIEKARELHPAADFRAFDILENSLGERFDYFLLSGALNYRVEDNMTLTRDMLAAMFELADEGVAVNFLTSYVNYEHPRNFHHQPEAVLSLARSMTRWVTIRHDYPLWEFTLFMYKNPRGSLPLLPAVSPSNP
jgi:SAM-dependent methyltransferase